MSKLELSKEKIVEVLESKSPKSLTEVYRLLGGKKLSGSTAKTMRSLVEGIDEWVANNKASVPTKTEPVPKSDKEKFRTSKKPGKKTAKVDFPRHISNPFRTNSNYALAFDILAANKEGLPLPAWRELYAKAAKKSLKLASYDIQVLLTAKDTPAGERHRSCRDGFYIEREGDHVTLKIG